MRTPNLRRSRERNREREEEMKRVNENRVVDGSWVKELGL